MTTAAFIGALPEPVIAYAILRAQGVGLDKADYVAHMFAYLRPGTEPSR